MGSTKEANTVVVTKSGSAVGVPSRLVNSKKYLKSPVGLLRLRSGEPFAVTVTDASGLPVKLTEAPDPLSKE
jgi:hypothetical protein